MERMFDDMEKHPEDSRNNREMDCESFLWNERLILSDLWLAFLAFTRKANRVQPKIHYEIHALFHCLSFGFSCPSS